LVKSSTNNVPMVQPAAVSAENPHLLQDNILYLALIGKRNFHTYLISDMEAGRCKNIFKGLIAKDSDCHEGYFGLAKIYFHLNRLEVAFDCIHKACRLKPQDLVYVLWKGLILFYIVSFRNLHIGERPEELPALRTQFRDCYDALTLAASLSRDTSLAALFLLVKLCAHAERFDHLLKLRFKKSAKDFALKIATVEKYLGYMAWAEIYIADPSKRHLGLEVLSELVTQEPTRPQAYLRMWSLSSLQKDVTRMHELAEQLFICGAGFQSVEIK